MLFLGIDMGTSYFKAAVVDRNGILLGLGRAPSSIAGTNGRKELSTENFWRIIASCIYKALLQAGKEITEIVSISYASQANTFILLDKNYNELTPLIAWNDDRADLHPELEAFSSQPEWAIHTGMGGALSKYAGINKLKWFQKNKPALWKRTAHVFTLPDYLAFGLTGKKKVDTSSASLSGLLDLDKGAWWPEALRISGLTEELVSQPCGIGTAIGAIQAGRSAINGLSQSTIVYAGGLDHHIAAIGSGMGSYADISESTGTVVAAVMHSDDKEPKRNVYIARGLEPEHYFRMAFDLNGAAPLASYQENHAVQYDIETLLKMAAAVPQGSKRLVALPCSDTYPGLTGFENISPEHSTGHYVRAIMESTAYSLKKLVAEMNIKKQNPVIATTGGGARSRLWAEIKSQVLGVPFILPPYNESACYGAAIVAATGFGMYNSIFDTQEAWMQKERIQLINNE